MSGSQPAEAEDWEEAWIRTGRVRCDDCGTKVRCRNLASLPPHNCTQRQQAQRAELEQP